MHVGRSTPPYPTLLMEFRYSAYTSGIMIAYSACQKALAGSAYDHELAFLSGCVEVLAYCSARDDFALSFHDNLKSHLARLLQHSPSPKSDEGKRPMERSATNEALFITHSGTTQLHSMASDLLQLIHRPFSGLPKVVPRKTLSHQAETIMGTHLEWEWELAMGQQSSLDGLMDSTHVQSPPPAATEIKKLLLSLQTPPQREPWSTLTPPITIKTPVD